VITVNVMPYGSSDSILLSPAIAFIVEYCVYVTFVLAWGEICVLYKNNFTQTFNTLMNSIQNNTRIGIPTDSPFHGE